jgi:hypothetical protein
MMDHLLFFVSEYYATGEGITVSILITVGAPSNQENVESARKEFVELFGEFISIGIEQLTRAEFVPKVDKYIPPKILENLDTSCCNFKYYSQFHINCS